MRLYEYEVKDLLARAGMNTPRRVPVGSRFDAVAAAETLGGPVAVKAQTLIKARGKAGLIRFASTAAEVEEAADNILGREHHGEKIETLLIEEKLGLEKEMYLGLVVDYAAGRPVLLASPSGGVEIEEIAARDPHLVLKQSITPSRGLTGEQARIAAGFLAGDGGSPELIEELAKAALTLYDLFVQRDLEMLEVNPLVLTCPGRVTALDGAAVVDGDALFRQPDLVKPRNQSLADFERERNFAARGWTYLKFPGNIGILSSGAGITMSILDLMHMSGGRPANFLDTAQMDRQGIYDAFQIFLDDPAIKTVLVNIFAGLNRCDHLAEGIRDFLSRFKPEFNLVVRMAGNREEEGFQILREIGIQAIRNLEKAVEKAIAVTEDRR